MRNAVSLLPVEYLNKRKRDHNLVRARSVLIAVIFLLLAGLAAIAALILSMVLSLSSVQDQNLKAQMQIQQLAKYEKLATETQQLQDKVDSVSATDPRWLEQLLRVANVLPRGVWLENFNSVVPERNDKMEPTSINCELLCGAGSLEDIARTIAALEESVAIRAVCTNTTTTEEGVRFLLTVTMSLDQPS